MTQDSPGRSLMGASDRKPMKRPETGLIMVPSFTSYDLEMFRPNGGTSEGPSGCGFIGEPVIV